MARVANQIEFTVDWQCRIVMDSIKPIQLLKARPAISSNWKISDVISRKSISENEAVENDITHRPADQSRRRGGFLRRRHGGDCANAGRKITGVNTQALIFYCVGFDNYRNYRAGLGHPLRSPSRDECQGIWMRTPWSTFIHFLSSFTLPSRKPALAHAIWYVWIGQVTCSRK